MGRCARARLGGHKWGRAVVAWKQLPALHTQAELPSSWEQNLHCHCFSKPPRSPAAVQVQLSPGRDMRQVWGAGPHPCPLPPIQPSPMQLPSSWKLHSHSSFGEEDREGGNNEVGEVAATKVQLPALQPQKSSSLFSPSMDIGMGTALQLYRLDPVAPQASFGPQARYCWPLLYSTLRAVNLMQFPAEDCVTLDYLSHWPQSYCHLSKVQTGSERCGMW